MADQKPARGHGRSRPDAAGTRSASIFLSRSSKLAEWLLAAENASRLAAMQRAEKNIDDLMGSLNQTFRRMRQTSIDEELFEVLSGYESMIITGNLSR